MFDPAQIALGAAAVCVAYFLYLVATKGLPAALAWVKAKWNAGKADLAALQAEIAGVQIKVASIETVALADIKARLSALEATGIGKIAAAAAAPASQVALLAVAAPAAPAAG
jgi:hypothetical protein